MDVRDIRDEKNLYFILGRSQMADRDHVTFENTVIVVNLFYEWQFQENWGFLRELASVMKVVIVTSKDSVFQMACELKENENCTNLEIRKKENRGRDISALLVSSEDLARKYEFFCFVHDKAEKTDNTCRTTKTMKWKDSLWTNTIGSLEYVKDVLRVFNENPQIGLLLPPEKSAERNDWGKNYSNSIKLCEMLGVNAKLDQSSAPISLGTMFWCRTRALEKLFRYPWKYEDFDNEPLADDGTISHAIERCLPYIAKDAGFETGTIFEYGQAIEYINTSRRSAYDSFKYLSGIGIHDFDDLKYFYERMKMIGIFAKKYGGLYIYGAGTRAIDAYKILDLIGVKPKAFITTTETQDRESLLGLPIIQIDCLDINPREGVIIGVSDRFAKEVIGVLEDRGIHTYILPFEEGDGHLVESFD